MEHRAGIRTTAGRSAGVSALLVLLSLLAALSLLACDDDSGGSGKDPLFLAYCADYAEAYCAKTFECSPVAAPMIWEVDSAAGCRSAAEKECSEDGGGEGEGEGEGDDDEECEPKALPTDAQIDACVEQIHGTACEDLDRIEYVGACNEVYEVTGCPRDGEGEEGEGEGGEGEGEEGEGEEGEGEEGEGEEGEGEEGEGEEGEGEEGEGEGTPEVHTEGCVAAVGALCTAVSACSGDVALPPRISDALAGCSQSVADNAASIEAACQAYLEAGLQSGDSMAAYLNEASADQVSGCVTGQNCDRAFIISVMEAFATFLTTGNSADLATLLAPLLAGCYTP